MIIIDMNQIMISNLMAQLKNDKLNEKLVRHMVLSSLRSYEQKYGRNTARWFSPMTPNNIGESNTSRTTNRIERKIEKVRS